MIVVSVMMIFVDYKGVSVRVSGVREQKSEVRRQMTIAQGYSVQSLSSVIFLLTPET